MDGEGIIVWLSNQEQPDMNYCRVQCSLPNYSACNNNVNRLAQAWDVRKDALIPITQSNRTPIIHFNEKPVPPRYLVCRSIHEITDGELSP